MERRQIVSLKHLSFIVFVAGVLVFVLFYIQFHPVHYFAHGSGCDVLCDEHVCVCVCVSVCLFAGYLRKPHKRCLPNFGARGLWPWLGPSPERERNPKGKGQFWGFSFPLTMHCAPFGTLTKTAEPIAMPFGMISGLRRGTMCYVG